MIRWDTYFPDGDPIPDYRQAHDRKEFLRMDGWRVKIRKTSQGFFQVWKKHKAAIDDWNHDHRFGNRKQSRKIPKGVIS